MARAIVAIDNGNGTKTMKVVFVNGQYMAVGSQLLNLQTEAAVRGFVQDGLKVVTATEWPDEGQEYLYLWRDGQLSARKWDHGRPYLLFVKQRRVWHPLRECVDNEYE